VNPSPASRSRCASQAVVSASTGSPTTTADTTNMTPTATTHSIERPLLSTIDPTSLTRVTALRRDRPPDPTPEDP
jgi:hypothetical protein